MKNTPTINRIAGAMTAIHAQGITATPDAQDAAKQNPKGKSKKRKFKDEDLDERLDFGDDDIPNDDDWDDDDDDDDEEEYMEELLEVATDDRAALVDAKIIYLRHPTDPENKMLMVAEVDEFLPPQFNLDGDEMWKGEIIIRMRKGREKATIKPVLPNPEVFKKKNYAKKII